MGSTSATLLGRLRDLTNRQAWQEFQDRYRPRLVSWCRSKGLQLADAEEVAQNVLVRVARKMPTFDYAPGSNFSGWLWTLWHNAWVDFLDDVPLGGKGTGDSTVQDQLARIATDDPTEQLKEEFDRELLEEALARARTRVSQRDWDIFHSIAFGDKTASDMAGKYGIKLTLVATVKSRVQKKVREEIGWLEGRGREKGADER